MARCRHCGVRLSLIFHAFLLPFPSLAINFTLSTSSATVGAPVFVRWERLPDDFDSFIMAAVDVTANAQVEGTQREVDARDKNVGQEVFRFSDTGLFRVVGFTSPNTFINPNVQTTGNIKITDDRGRVTSTIKEAAPTRERVTQDPDLATARRFPISGTAVPNAQPSASSSTSSSTTSTLTLHTRSSSTQVLSPTTLQTSPATTAQPSSIIDGSTLSASSTTAISPEMPPTFEAGTNSSSRRNVILASVFSPIAFLGLVLGILIWCRRRRGRRPLLRIEPFNAAEIGPSDPQLVTPSPASAMENPRRYLISSKQLPELPKSELDQLDSDATLSYLPSSYPTFSLISTLYADVGSFQSDPPPSYSSSQP